jgi:hypothetical protein
MKIKSETLLFILLVGTLIPLEIICALLAYETLGEITSQLYFISVIGINLLLVMLAFRYRTIATLGIVGLALLIIPYQVILGNRLIRVQAETTRIVSFVYEQNAQNGTFPTDLSKYTFHDMETKAYIQSYELDAENKHFMVFYRVGTESTSHWYSSKDGWGYYPD